MPLPVASLLRGASQAAGAGTNPSKVLAFLRAQPDQAWRSIEVAEALGIDVHTLGAVLRRLRSRGLVDKQGAYWFVPGDADAARLASLHAVTHDLNTRLGVERRSDWPR